MLAKKNLILIFAVCLMLAQSVQAETSFVESIDWMVADSDLVVVGQIDFDLPRSKEESKLRVATITVNETLKGESKEDEIEIVLKGFSIDSLAELKQSQTPKLFCIQNKDRIKNQADLPEDAQWVLRMENRPSLVMLSEDETTGTQEDSTTFWRSKVNARTHKVLSDPKTIVDYIKTTVETQKENKPTHSIFVEAFDEVFNENWLGSAVYLKVPVDNRLESIGIEMVAAENADLRIQGAKLLEYFPTESNIAKLKKLLTDDYSYIVENNSKIPELRKRRQVFIVRETAYRVLTNMKIEVEKPTLSEELQPFPDLQNPPSPTNSTDGSPFPPEPTAGK